MTSPSTSATDQLVADLIWAVSSASLVVDPLAVPAQPLSASEVDTELLVRTLSAPLPHRVGRYFEQLVLFWLTHVRRVEIVSTGEQVQVDGRTIGEFDFLFRNEEGALTHCEAAIKFFLHHPREGTSHYPGPNARDNFEAKATKLFDQQLKLSAEHRPEVTAREAFVKGRIFTHLGDPPPDRLPPRLAPDHLGGTWLRADELPLLVQSRPGALVTVTTKPHWLAPVAAPPTPLDELAAILRSDESPGRHTLMATLHNGDLTEPEAVCIVPAAWPNLVS